jgi:hypothetical protein
VAARATRQPPDAARKAATTVCVVDGVGAHEELLEQLGPHTTGVGCIYVKDLTAVDLEVLETIVSPVIRRPHRRHVHEAGPLRAARASETASTERRSTQPL